MAVEPLTLTADSTARDGVSLAPSPLPTTTVTAFLGRTERGPINEAVSISSFDEYLRVFGGHGTSGFVSQAVQHYFLHGGEAAVVVRLANNARRASLEIGGGDGVLRLSARCPGSREYLRVSIDYDGVEDDEKRFNLVVQRLARPGSQIIEDQELFVRVSIDPCDRRYLVDALGASKLVQPGGPLPSRRPAATRPKHPGLPIPYLEMTTPGTDGDELSDYDVVGSDEEGTGLFALERIERVDLVCIPALPSRDLGTAALLAAERYCRRRRAMLIWDPPSSWRSSDAAVLGARALGLTTRNALTYFPRLRPRGDSGRYSAGLPACGAIAGVLAKGDAGAGYPVAPSMQLKASLTTAVDVTPRQATMLARLGVNPLVRGRAGGVLIGGNACFAPQDNVATLEQRLDTRRATLFVLGMLERATGWVRRAIADPQTPERLVRQLRELLAELHHRGLFAGRCEEDAFFVRASASDLESRPGITIRLGFALVRPGQFQIHELDYRRERIASRAVPPLDTAQATG